MQLSAPILFRHEPNLHETWLRPIYVDRSAKFTVQLFTTFPNACIVERVIRYIHSPGAIVEPVPIGHVLVNDWCVPVLKNVFLSELDPCAKPIRFAIH
jgi:hypothetical protein